MRTDTQRAPGTKLGNQRLFKPAQDEAHRILHPQLFQLRESENMKPVAWWLTPVIPALWEAEVGGSQGQELNHTLANTGPRPKVPKITGGGMGFHHDGQAGPELLTSGDPPTSASQRARITGVSHCAQPEKSGQAWWLRPVIPALWEAEAGGSRMGFHLIGQTGKKKNFFDVEFCSCCLGWGAMVLFQLTATSTSWVQASCLSLPDEVSQSWPDWSRTPDLSLALSHRLEYSGRISAHCNLYLSGSKLGFCHVGQAALELLTSDDIPVSASQSTGITDVNHHTCPHFFLSPELEMRSNYLSYESETKIMGYKLPRGFHHVGQASLELPISGDLPALASKMGFHHDGQAGLELLTSGDPPTSASQSARITGGDVYLIRQLTNGDLKAILHIIEDLGIILIRHKCESQALGAKSACSGHLMQPLLLGHPTVDGNGCKVLLHQLLDQGNAPLHRLHKDHHLVELKDIQKMKELLVLLVLLQFHVVLLSMQRQLRIIIHEDLHWILHELSAD
ncbi:hypothetical protein AAY473_023998 [Plecturocebus cupreus]